MCLKGKQKKESSETKMYPGLTLSLGEVRLVLGTFSYLMNKKTKTKGFLCR